MKKLLILLTLAQFMICAVPISVLAKSTEKKEIRVIGGKKDDFKDSKGVAWCG